MQRVLRSIEETGRTFTINGLYSGLGLVNNIRLAVWDGIFNYGVNSGYSPFNSGLVAGYFAGDDAKTYAARTIRGGIYGVVASIKTRLAQNILHRKYLM